jgi:hypothetical protein
MGVNAGRDYFEIEAELKKRIEGDIRFDRYSRLLYSTDASIYQCRATRTMSRRRSRSPTSSA